MTVTVAASRGSWVAMVPAIKAPRLQPINATLSASISGRRSAQSINRRTSMMVIRWRSIASRDSSRNSDSSAAATSPGQSAR